MNTKINEVRETSLIVLSQMLAMATGNKLVEVAEAVSRSLSTPYLKREQTYADDFFYSIYRLMQKSQPDFEK